MQRFFQDQDLLFRKCGLLVHFILPVPSAIITDVTEI